MRITDFFKNVFGFGNKDACVLKISLMVAALDGVVADEELHEVQALLAEKVKSEETRKTLWAECLRCAGYVLLLAKIFSRDELVSAFVQESLDILIPELPSLEPDVINQAFDAWTAVAKSDGDFCALEMDALAALRKAVQEQQTRLLEAISVSAGVLEPAGGISSVPR